MRKPPVPSSKTAQNWPKAFKVVDMRVIFSPKWTLFLLWLNTAGPCQISNWLPWMAEEDTKYWSNNLRSTFSASCHELICWLYTLTSYKIVVRKATFRRQQLDHQDEGRCARSRAPEKSSALAFNSDDMYFSVNDINEVSWKLRYLCVPVFTKNWNSVFLY